MAVAGVDSMLATQSPVLVEVLRRAKARPRPAPAAEHVRSGDGCQPRVAPASNSPPHET